MHGTAVRFRVVSVKLTKVWSRKKENRTISSQNWLIRTPCSGHRWIEFTVNHFQKLSPNLAFGCRGKRVSEAGVNEVRLYFNIEDRG